MNEEERKAVEELKSCITFWQCQLISTDEKEEIEMAEREIAVNINLLNLIEKQQKEIEKKDRQIDLMADFIDRIDEKSEHCRGYLCTVATTYYPEEERKKICSNCIKGIFKNKAEEN